MDAAPFCENYAKLYFDAKHLAKRVNMGGGRGLGHYFQKKFPFFIKKVPFLANIECCPKFKDYTLQKHIKGELHLNYIFLHFALIGLEWDSITLSTKMNFFFQNSNLHKIYIYMTFCLLTWTYFNDVNGGQKHFNQLST